MSRFAKHKKERRYKIGSAEIKSSQSERRLGVNINSLISSENHVNNICSKN